MKPRRIQRKRTKGWKMPENAVYVGRPSVWGNRWKPGIHSNTLGRTVASVEEAVSLYRSQWVEKPNNGHFRAFIRERLRGKDLACWCPLDQPCHADVLLEIANGTD